MPAKKTLKTSPKHKNAVKCAGKCTVPAKRAPLATQLKVPLDAPFVDARGVIQNILHQDCGAVVLITSEKGSVRADHWHRTDAHVCYVLYGKIEYRERPVGSKNLPSQHFFKQGEAFYTGPNVEHSMYFPEKTAFLTLADRHRSPEDYEKDLVRLTEKLTDLPVESNQHPPNTSDAELHTQSVPWAGN